MLCHVHVNFRNVWFCKGFELQKSNITALRDVNLTFDLVAMTNEKYRQCTYNVTLIRVPVTIVAMEKPSVLCILSVCL
jgi:hypothetical protein